MRSNQCLSFTVRWLYSMVSENNSDLTIWGHPHEAIIFTQTVCVNLKVSNLIRRSLHLDVFISSLLWRFRLCAHGGQRRASDSLKLELQVVSPKWVPGTELSLYVAHALYILWTYFGSKSQFLSYCNFCPRDTLLLYVGDTRLKFRKTLIWKIIWMRLF